MATPFDPTLPSSSFLFDIYADGQAAPAQPKLPSGPCNFTDTGPGATGAKCGCRRFWSRQSAVRGTFGDNANSDQVSWCMCSHHACYHDDFAPGQAPLSMGDVLVVEQENARPRTNREPLSPMQDMASIQMPTTVPGSMDLSLLDIPASLAYTNQVIAAEPPRSLGHSNGQDSSLPDTLNWGTFLASQPGQDASFPPIPPQCLLPTGPPSTASSSQARYLRPFAGKGLQTLSGASAAKAREPLLDRIVETSVPPEAAGPFATDALRADEGAEDARSSVTMTGISRDALQHLSKTVQGHEQRLDRLENTSFSVAGHEECHEKHDHTDLRVTELESRVEEVEKILNNDGSSVGSARRHLMSDTATASVASVATTAAGASEMYSQLQALQAQVSHLQSTSAPSYNNPWELEVVFLPFPLRGIWLEARDIQAATQTGVTGRNSGDWTQMPNTGSRAAAEPLSTSAGPAYGDFHGPDWLLPRACAPGGMVDKRLRSRGLVKTIAVRGADARSVQVAINSAFTDVIRVGASDVASRALVHRVPRNVEPPPLGLQQTWVPLRKIHKDSRLRFLAPAELVTPSLWDYAFLTSSVVMKASGLQRLYITQREAYLQDHPIGYQAWESCWTWQKLRTLTRVYPDSQSSSNGDVPKADAKEACWAWNDRLDEPPSSITSRPATQPNRSWARRSSKSPSQQYFTGVQSPILSNSPGAIRAHSPLTLKDRRAAARPDHIRTNSLPSVAPSTSSPSLLKRRVSSTISPYERRPSPLIQRSSPRPQPFAATTTTTTSFKRRTTRSPSFVPRITPRWSQARLSRSPSLAPFAQVFDNDRSSERRTTPFCYATPYSNAPASARATSRGPVAAPNPYYADEDEDDDDDHNDDDEEMGEGGSDTDPYDDDDDRSEATNEFSPRSHRSRELDLLVRGGAGDEGMEIDVYEDELSGLDDSQQGGGRGGGGGGWQGLGRGVGGRRRSRSNTATRYLGEQGHAHGQGQQQQGVMGVMATTAPEDEPWPGIEDMSSDDGENVDPDMERSSSQEGEEGEGEGGMMHVGDVSMGRRGETTEEEEEEEEERGPRHRRGSSCPSEYPSTQSAWHVTPGPDIGEGQGRGDSGIGFRIHEDLEDAGDLWD